MGELLKFILRYSSWFLFAVYMAAGCVLLFSGNPYQHHVYLTSANRVSSWLYGTVSGVTSYFSLRGINDDLQRRNNELELEIYRLNAHIRTLAERIQADTIEVIPQLSRYDFIIGHVINNSTTHSHNYITIDKGRLDGVEPEMGVMDRNGIVGIVNVVGDHSARLISLLNPYQRVSCRVKGHAPVGSLVWDGRDPSQAILEELPKHTVFAPGDTIETSGYSTVFPPGVPVGTVLSSTRDLEDNFYTLRVKLFTDFTTLSTVRIIRDRMRPELEAVEKEIEIKNVN